MPELTASTREAARRLGVSDTAIHKAERAGRISRLPVEETAEKRKRFKTYEIGYVHIDSCELRHADGKLVMFLAIDRVSKFTYVEFHDSAGRMEGSAFLRNVVEVFLTKSTPCSPTTVWPSPTCPIIATAPAGVSSDPTSSTASASKTVSSTD